MKSTATIFKEILTETGFGNYKPSEMSNSDYWMCTEKAMERYANQFKNESKDKWIKIESEDDLPDEFCELWVVCKGNGAVRFREFFGKEKRAYISLYSHYQPIVKPQPPLY